MFPKRSNGRTTGHGRATLWRRSSATATGWDRPTIADSCRSPMKRMADCVSNKSKRCCSVAEELLFICFAAAPMSSAAGSARTAEALRRRAARATKLRIQSSRQPPPSARYTRMRSAVTAVVQSASDSWFCCKVRSMSSTSIKVASPFS